MRGLPRDEAAKVRVADGHVPQYDAIWQNPCSEGLHQMFSEAVGGRSPPSGSRSAARTSALNQAESGCQRGPRKEANRAADQRTWKCQVSPIRTLGR